MAALKQHRRDKDAARAAKEEAQRPQNQVAGGFRTSTRPTLDPPPSYLMSLAPLALHKHWTQGESTDILRASV